MLAREDVPAVLDQLERWNAAGRAPFDGRLDLEHVGMSGHSFGAVTTQAVSGQTFPRRQAASPTRASKPRSRSAPAARAAAMPKQAFGEVKIPWLLMTGTKDDAPIGDQTVESRLAVFPALPAGDKYELVLDRRRALGVHRSALPGDKEKRNPNHHRAILASTAFWDAYLREDDGARTWLHGPDARSVLEERDRWQLQGKATTPGDE